MGLISHSVPASSPKKGGLGGSARPGRGASGDCAFRPLGPPRGLCCSRTRLSPLGHLCNFRAPHRGPLSIRKPQIERVAPGRSLVTGLMAPPRSAPDSQSSALSKARAWGRGPPRSAPSRRGTCKRSRVGFRGGPGPDGPILGCLQSRKWFCCRHQHRPALTLAPPCDHGQGLEHLRASGSSQNSYNSHTLNPRVQGRAHVLPSPPHTSRGVSKTLRIKHRSVKRCPVYLGYENFHGKGRLGKIV